MKKNPLLSVIMPVHNGEKYLKKAVESVLKQTYGHFELLITNDGSTDKTKKIIESYSSKDKRIKPIHLEKKGGISNAMNIAIRRAKGKFIVRADGDDICLPNRFEEQLKYISVHTHVGVLGSYYSVFNNNISDCQHKEYHSCFIHDGLPPVNHPTSLIRKELFAKCGYYDSRFDDAEDTELWYRWYSKGVVFNNIPKYLYLKRIHPDSVSIARLRKQVFLMLKINLIALIKYKIHFSVKGYIRIVELLFYSGYLFLKPKQKNNG